MLAAAAAVVAAAAAAIGWVRSVGTCLCGVVRAGRCCAAPGCVVPSMGTQGFHIHLIDGKGCRGRVHAPISVCLVWLAVQLPVSSPLTWGSLQDLLFHWLIDLCPRGACLLEAPRIFLGIPMPWTPNAIQDCNFIARIQGGLAHWNIIGRF